jgi:hypothetical protein
MSEGGFLLVTREGKIWNAPQARIISAGERHCSPRGDGPRILCKYKVQIFGNHVRAKQRIERARAINFVKQRAPGDCYGLSRPVPSITAPPIRR